eukprot:gene45941-65142_t
MGDLRRQESILRRKREEEKHEQQQRISDKVQERKERKGARIRQGAGEGGQQRASEIPSSSS